MILYVWLHAAFGRIYAIHDVLFHQGQFLFVLDEYHVHYYTNYRQNILRKLEDDMTFIYSL